MNMQKFRDDLLTAMAQKGATQTDVSEKTGVLQSSLSFFLTGEREGLSGKNVLRLFPFVYGNLPPLDPVSQQGASPSLPEATDGMA